MLTRDPRALTSRRGTSLRAIACAGLLLVPCAASAQLERPAQSLRPSPPAEQPTPLARDSETALRDSVVALARSQVGRRYLFGGTDPVRGFDCSGFTRYLMRGLGIQIPRTAAQQARVGQEVPRDPSRLRVGDLLTFGKGNRVTHVGVYVGNGRYIHASSGAGRVVESRLDRPASSLVRAWYGVRRFMAARDSATTVAQAPVTNPVRPSGT